MPLRFHTLALAALLLNGCARSETRLGLITSFGEYPSPAGNFVLKVEKKEASLVVGTVLDSARSVVFSEEIGSNAMRWCFYWSSDGTLWAYSSDSGYLKQIQPKGSARSIQKGERLPWVVFDFLPSSLQGMYSK